MIVGHLNKRNFSFLGFHLEGPFINEEKKGAHPPVHLRDGFDNGFEDAKKTYGEENLDVVRMVTLAPELKNATAVIGELTKRGIKVSLGGVGFYDFDFDTCNQHLVFRTFHGLIDRRRRSGQEWSVVFDSFVQRHVTGK